MFDHVTREHVDSGFEMAGIRADGLFLPGADPEATELLLECLWRRRQASLLAAWLTVSQNFLGLAEETGFAAAVETYCKAPVVRRRAVMEDPCVRIWISRMIGLPPLSRIGAMDKDYVALRTLLSHGARLLRISRGAGFALQRFDVDPLLATAIPPSYSFDNLAARLQRETQNPYSLEFANEVITSALGRIGQIWPEARLDFDRFVKIILHLPDLDSRSCSAARFAGAILLSSYYDNTLLAVEESLVHECGHQVLYCVMELVPLIQDSAQRSFTLPWSGSKRDAYGYFHATYIYVILARFFERVANSDHHKMQQDALRRLTEILAGLERAVVDFAGADFFTDPGRTFFDRLAAQAAQVIERNRYLLIGPKSLGKYHERQSQAANTEDT